MATDGPSRIRWLERGEGQAVLLLHGLLGDMDHWEDVLPGVGGSCRASPPGSHC
jgi:pimeloyl-ACP methyl ester carboxylesterase